MHETTHDTTVIKVQARHSPRGELGQKYLAAGVHLGMRLWEAMQPGESKEPTTRDYETVGYVISGIAELEIENQKVVLEAGDSWVVPVGATHSYRCLESFTAVEATCPPAFAQGRDRL